MPTTSAAPAHKKAKEAPTEEGGAAAAAGKELSPPPPQATTTATLERPLGAALHTSPAAAGKRAATILESGRILFLARPTIAAEGAGKMEGQDDIRTFYIAFVPAAKDEAAAAAKDEEGAPAKQDEEWASKCRLIIVGRKKLPEKGEHFWGFVQAVGDTFADLFVKPKAKKEEAEAEAGGGAAAASKKRKAAAPPPADDDDARLRVLAEGDYALTRVGKAKSTGHLTYVLSEPHAPVASALAEVGVEASQRFVISVKNPATPNRGGGGLSKAQKAHFGPEALAAFTGSTERTKAHGLAWVNFSASPHLLNTVHAEVLLIGANRPEDSDPALAASLAAAAEADHQAHLAGGGGGDEAAAAAEVKKEEEHAEQHAEAAAAHGEEEAAVRAALEVELQAAALHLDVLPAVTGELD